MASCFPDVDFATLTRDAVYSCSVAGIRFILVGVEESLKFVGSGVVDLDACFLEDALEFVMEGALVEVTVCVGGFPVNTVV